MSRVPIYPFRHTQVILLLVVTLAAPIFAEQPAASAKNDRYERPKVPSSSLPDRQHYSPGAAEGVHFRHDVPTFRHHVGHMSAKPGPHDSYVATGRSIILSSPARVHHGHYYRSHRGYWRYPARSHWVPGYWKVVYKKVWIPGHWETRHIPAVYRKEFHEGREVMILIDEERWERVWVEGRYETHRERVWINGYWTRY
jgi:hypothetical protein